MKHKSGLPCPNYQIGNKELTNWLCNEISRGGQHETRIECLSNDMFTVWSPGFKSRVAKFTQLFTPE